MVDFVLEDFASSVTMGTAGTLASASIPSLDASSVAVLEVNLDNMKDVFQFQTDSTDFVNTAATDLKYLVQMANWPNLNPSNAMLDHTSATNPIATVGSDGSNLAANKMMVCHDYTRYLAVKLFSTHFGVDLFNNEPELLQNLRTVTGVASSGQTWYDISASLVKVSTTGDHTGIVTGDASGNYMTNAQTANTNICKSLFDQLMGAAASRFSGLGNSGSFQSLPFAADDTISFKLTVAAATNQHNLTGVSAIGNRVYKIKLVMKASPSNTAVDSNEE